MKKLLLTFGLMSAAATLYAANYVTGEKLTTSTPPKAETKVIIEGWVNAGKGYLTKSPDGTAFAALDKTDVNRLVFDDDYVYTLIPVEGSENGEFYIKSPSGLYAPIASADMNGTDGMEQNGVEDVKDAGKYVMGASSPITTAQYADKYMLVNTNQAAAGKSHLEVHINHSKDNKWCYFETGVPGMQDAGNSGRTACAFAIYEVQEVFPVDVTFTYPAFGGNWKPDPITVKMIPGTKLTAENVPALEYFTVKEFENEVGETDCTFEVSGEWTFPFALNRVFRADLRKSELNGCTDWAVVNNQISTRNNTNASAFSPENLFYFNGHGFNADNRFVVTLHTTELPDEQGYECSANNNAQGKFSENPTKWVIKQNATGTEGVSLQHTDNVISHANDISGILGVWAYAGSINDGGSFVRFKDLTDSDYTATVWEHNERKFNLDAELMAKVKDNPTPDNVRAVFAAIEEPMMVLTFKRSADDADPATVEVPYLPSIKEATEYPGFTVTDSEFVPDKYATVTYVMNEGTSFRIFNERAGKYVNVANKGLYQTADAEDATIDFVRVPAGEDDAFVIYNPAADVLVGNILGTQAATAVVAFGQMPTKYYTGKQETPTYTNWLGNRPASDDAEFNFFNDFQHTFVCGYSWNDAGSKWVLVTDQKNFEDNWELRNQLLESQRLYTRALEILGEEDTDNLANFAKDYDFDGDVNKPVSDENRAKIEKMTAKIQEAADKFVAGVMDTDKLYTIQSESDDRGAIIYDPDIEMMTTTGQGVKADSTNDNHLWGFVKVGEKHYLYNLGAKKFASAYTPRLEGEGTATYVWGVSEIPTAVELTTEAFGKQEAFDKNRFTIEGGRNNAGNRPGMMIINGNNNPYKVPCSLGEKGDITDGTSFVLTAAEATSGIVAEMAAKVTEGFNKVNETVTELGKFEKWDADVEGVTVGHYTPEAVEAFTTAINAAKDNADKETALYDALEAKVTFDNAEKRKVAGGNVYSIADSEGNVYYTDGTELKVGEFTDTEVAYSYWVADVDEENGAVSFSHSHDEAVVPFAVNEAVAFLVELTDELGKVSLLNAEDNTPVDEKTYTIKFVSTDADEALTSHLTELNADTAKTGAIYDLQGRRLAAPAKGINIIGGRKVLVK